MDDNVAIGIEQIDIYNFSAIRMTTDRKSYLAPRETALI